MIQDKSKIKDIDVTDSAMITLLQKDGRLSNTEIGKKLGISESTVRLRLKRLIEEEFIQIVAVSNPFKLGFKLTGNIYIDVEMKKIHTVIEQLKALKGLWYIILTTGTSNINAEFIVKDQEELNDLIYNRISEIDGITKLETSIIMKFEKRNYEYGTSLE